MNASTIRKKLSHGMAAVGKKISRAKTHAAQRTKRAVRQNPWPYIAGSAVGGALLGMAVKRAR